MTLPVLYIFSFSLHLGARWAYYFEILREYLTGGKICRMVSFQISYIAKITFSWLLDLRGPKRKMQSAVNSIRQVTFQLGVPVCAAFIA